MVYIYILDSTDELGKKHVCFQDRRAAREKGVSGGWPGASETANGEKSRIETNDSK